MRRPTAADVNDDRLEGLSVCFCNAASCTQDDEQDEVRLRRLGSPKALFFAEPHRVELIRPKELQVSFRLRTSIPERWRLLLGSEEAVHAASDDDRSFVCSCVKARNASVCLDSALEIASVDGV